MKNTLVDLNNHLFEQMERLNDEELTPDQLDMEIKRAKAMTAIATNIIDNGTLALNSQKYIDEEYGIRRNGNEIPENLKLVSKDAQVHR